MKNVRMVGEREKLITDAAGDFVGLINEQGRWAELVSTLGQETWQCPMGLLPGAANMELPMDERYMAFVRKVATVEVRQEVGLRVHEVRMCHRVTPNETFFPFAQYVAMARCVEIGEPDPEDLEHIVGKGFFTPAEIRTLVEKGELRCAMSQAALAQAGVQLGDLPNW